MAVSWMIGLKTAVWIAVEVVQRKLCAEAFAPYLTFCATARCPYAQHWCCETEHQVQQRRAGVGWFVEVRMLCGVTVPVNPDARRLRMHA
jgi:hypothetical protein